MKRTLILSLLVAAMGVIAFMGCEKPEQVENPTTTTVASQSTDSPSQSPVTHNTELSYTQCKTHGQKSIAGETISTNYE
ncbi:MAG: hypothetical protein II088_04350, partial [Bacteroidales bacterium]|nr:hypothetical protein [Bacteroidales bacterium]